MTQTQSKEDIQKLQEKADAFRYAYIEKLDDAQKAKFKAIEDAIHQLNANGVTAYVFAMMPNPNAKDNLECMIQYNTLSRLLKFDEVGDLTLEAKTDIRTANESFLDAVFNLPFFQKTNSLIDDIKFLANLFARAIVNENRRYGKPEEKSETQETSEKKEDSVVPLQ